MADTFFLNMESPDFGDKMHEMYRCLDGQDPLLSALIGAAHIDKCLVSLLENFLVQGKSTKKKHLQSGGGLLNSLYTRAEFAYMLGLITSDMLTNIKTICEIRNHFAHSHVELTFDSEVIFNLCRDLKVPGSKDTPYPDPDTDYDISDYENYRNLPRHRFTDTVSLTVMELARIPVRLKRLSTPYIDGEPEE